MTTHTDEDTFTTRREEGQWWCYYAGLATTGNTRARAELEMRKWLAERDPNSPTYTPA